MKGDETLQVIEKITDFSLFRHGWCRHQNVVEKIHVEVSSDYAGSLNRRELVLVQHRFGAQDRLDEVTAEIHKFHRFIRWGDDSTADVVHVDVSKPKILRRENQVAIIDDLIAFVVFARDSAASRLNSSIRARKNRILVIDD